MSRVRAEGLAPRRLRWRSRASVAVPLVSALILVLGWSSFWIVARWQAAAALDRFVGEEAAHGRAWSCPDRTITGFPFRIAIACAGVTFSGVFDRSPAEGRLGGLGAEAYLYEPNAVDLTLAGPMTLKTRDGRDDFSLDWSAFHATLRGLTGGLSRVELAIDGATLTRADTGPIQADHLVLHAGPAPGQPADSAADLVDVTVTGAGVPLLDALTGEAAALDGHVSSVVTRAFGDLPDLGPETVERWRKAGGRVDIADLSISKGPLSATASGQLGLDAQHRLAGRLAASLKGFGPLAKRYGIPLGAVEIGGFVSHLLGKGGGSAPAAPAPGAVDLPITFADGTMSIGPFALPVRLRPLY